VTEKVDPGKAEELVRMPVAVRSPSYNSDGSISIPRSPDRHHIVHGFVNGCPVTWLIDTGATITTIPLRMARACGIRAGKMAEVLTGGGTVKVGVSEENRIGVGPVAVPNMKVAVSGQIPLAVLGMNVLERFRMSMDEDGVMTLRPLQAK
jgi:aspartyl protease family protein